MSDALKSLSCWMHYLREKLCGCGGVGHLSELDENCWSDLGVRCIAGDSATVYCGDKAVWPCDLEPSDTKVPVMTRCRGGVLALVSISNAKTRASLATGALPPRCRCLTQDGAKIGCQLVPRLYAVAVSRDQSAAYQDSVPILPQSHFARTLFRLEGREHIFELYMRWLAKVTLINFISLSCGSKKWKVEERQKKTRLSQSW